MATIQISAKDLATWNQLAAGGEGAKTIPKPDSEGSFTIEKLSGTELAKHILAKYLRGKRAVLRQVDLDSITDAEMKTIRAARA